MLFRDMFHPPTHTNKKSLVRRRCRVYIKNIYRHHSVIVITTACFEGSKRLRVYNTYTCSDVVVHNNRAMTFRSVCSARFFILFFFFAVAVSYTCGVHRDARASGARNFVQKSTGTSFRRSPVTCVPVTAVNTARTRAMAGNITAGRLRRAIPYIHTIGFISPNGVFFFFF